SREAYVELHAMARCGFETKVAHKRREDRRHFEHCETHADANPWAAAEGQVGVAMPGLHLFWGETARVKGVWLLPEFLMAVEAPDRDAGGVAPWHLVRTKSFVLPPPARHYGPPPAAPPPPP